MNRRSSRAEVALVTGAGKGIGLEIARGLGRAGLTVFVGARDRARGQQAVDTLLTDRIDARLAVFDVRDARQVDRAARAIDHEVGVLDVLVNNAGVVVEWGVPTLDIGAELLREAFEVNTIGPATVTRAVLGLLRRSANARIVNLSSPLGSLALLSDPTVPIAARGLTAYSTSKAALNALTLIQARALGPEGIRVNAVNPGLVATDLNRDSPFDRGSSETSAGAQAPIALALTGPDGPTGQFRDCGPAETTLPW